MIPVTRLILAAIGFLAAAIALAADSLDWPLLGRNVDNVTDLRFSSAETHGQLAGIVIGGLRKEQGMPVFQDITIEEVKAFQAYVLVRAWAGYSDAGKSKH